MYQIKLLYYLSAQTSLNFFKLLNFSRKKTPAFYIQKLSPLKAELLRFSIHNEKC